MRAHPLSWWVLSGTPAKCRVCFADGRRAVGQASASAKADITFLCSGPVWAHFPARGLAYRARVSV